MARYSAFLGRRVEVQYRAGDILLPASGTFVADSGRSIFLEQSFELRGSQRHFRWEIPYQYIVRLAEKMEPTQGEADILGSPAGAMDPGSPSSPASMDSSAQEAARTVTSSGGAPAILPLQNRPKTA
jgi:hypothetical protein